MSVWKSPVLYFGVLLFLAVAAALAAPFVLDWNRYKPQLEAYGARLTGRVVKIDGDVEIRLFPIPRLEAGDVRVFNPGTTNTVLAAADKVTVEVTLGGLLNGNLDVQAINFDAPVINLVRRGNGDLNFLLQPDEDLRRSTLLRNVSLARIAVRNGTFVLRDEGKVFERTVNNVDAVLSAPRIEGPWRITGAGINGGYSFGFSLTSSAYEPKQSFRFGLRLSPNDPVVPQVFVDAAINDGAMEGTVRAQSETVEGEKSSQENSFSNLNMVGKLKADFNGFSLTNIKVTPQKTTDGSTLIEGEIAADYSNAGLAGTIVNSRFDAPRFNLSGASGLSTVYLMERVGAALSGIPESFRVNSTFDVAALSLPDGMLENVQMVADIDRNALKIRRLSAKMPGRSQMLFRGVAFPNGAVTDLQGEVAFESGDLRQFTGWLSPEWSEETKQYWKGNRGRAKAEGKVSWSEGRVSFSNLQYEVDGLRGTGTVSFQAAGKGNSDVTISVPVVDLDSYLQAPGSGEKLNAVDFVRRLTNGVAKVERRVALTSDRVTLNGTVMENVDFDIVSGPAGLVVHKAKVASIDGAALTLGGEVLTQGGAPQGSLNLSLQAKDLSGVIGLVGFGDNKELRQVANALGETDVTGALTLAPNGARSAATYNVSAKSVNLELSAKGDVVAADQTGPLSARGEVLVAAPDGRLLLQLFGIEPRARPTGVSELRANYSGDMSKGFETQGSLKALDLAANFKGTMADPLSVRSFAGSFDAKGESLTTAVGALGMPVVLPAGRVDVAGTVTQGEKGQEVSFKGTVAGGDVSGVANVDVGQPLGLDLALPEVSLADVSSALLLQWDGEPAAVSHRLADVEESYSNAEVWLRPKSLRIAEGLTSQEAVIGLKTEGAKRSLTLRAQLPEKALKVNVVSQLDGDAQAADIEIDGPLPLAVLFVENGKAVLRGKLDVSAQLKGAGRSLSALLTSLKGSGSFKSGEIVVADTDVTALAAGVGAVTDDASLRTAMRHLTSGAGSVFGAGTGSLSIDNGRVVFSPIKQRMADADVGLRLSGDLTDQSVEAVMSVQLARPANAPPIEIAQSGAMGATKRQTRTSSLVSMLGFSLLARDLAEMEKLQAEQERLAKQEAEQLKQDEEKFEAYQAQRAELRQRQRELRVHAQERARAAKVLAAELERATEEAGDARKDELPRFRRQLSVFELTANGGRSVPVKPNGLLPAGALEP